MNALRPWPEKTLAAQAAAFEGKRSAKRLEQIQRLLETLAALGQAEEVRPGMWER